MARVSSSTDEITRVTKRHCNIDETNEVSPIQTMREPKKKDLQSAARRRDVKAGEKHDQKLLLSAMLRY